MFLLKRLVAVVGFAIWAHFTITSFAMGDSSQGRVPGDSGGGRNQAGSVDPATRVRADSIYSIPEIFNGIALLNGQSVRVFGSYVSGNDSKLVTDYTAYSSDELMPLHSIIFVAGILPDSLYWHGGVMIVTGIVTKSTNPLPVYPQDTIDITISAVSYEYLLNVEPDTIPNLKLNLNEGKSGDDFREIEACDPCKFALLISGGGSGANNKPTYWNNIEALYNYKTDPAGGNYCPENVKIVYYLGNSGNAGHIPNSAVDSCSKANIQKAHDDLSKKIADCTRAGKDATVQKMVTNHGSSNGNIVLLGSERLTPAELRAMQQGLIDSCADFFYDEFIECYGGKVVEEMKNLNDLKKTEIHANSASGPNSPGWSPWNGEHLYLQEKIRALSAGDDYETAVAKAKKKYADLLDSLVVRKNRSLDSLRQILDTLNAGNPRKRHLDSLKSAWVKDSTAMAGSRNDGSRSFVRYIFKKYCEWKKFIVAPGGQAILDFKGTGGCGNSTIWCEDAAGNKKRVRVWNWNLPGSFGYVAGNNRRVINYDPACSTGVYWIHNDNGEFTTTIESSPHQNLTDTPSNQSTFAGFSVGGTDSSSAEFGNIIAPSYVAPGIDLPGFDLYNAPGAIGPCSGVGQFIAAFSAPAPNPYWNDMELFIRVNQVISPGILQVQCPTAEFPTATVPINTPGQTISIHLGAVGAPGTGQIIFSAVTGPCFTFDCWGLRSLVPTFPVYVCGDANGNSAVSISDVVYLINYIFAGGPAPNPVLAGDANCSGAVSISDAVYLINYIFGGGPAPCAACL